jgi:hypothetical protein
MRYDLLKAAAAVAVIAAGQSAWAQGARVEGEWTTSLRLDDNFAFAGTGTQFRASTAGNFTLYSETPTSRIEAGSGLTFQMDPAGNFSVSRPSLRFGFTNRNKRTQYTAGASFVSGPIRFEELQDDLSLVDQEADQTRIRANFGINTRLSETLRARLDGSVQSLDFDPVSSELAPSTDYNLTASLSYTLSQRTSLDLSTGIGWFEGEGDTNEESFSTNLGVAVGHQLDPRTRVSANLGLSYVDNAETVGGILTEEQITSVLFGAGLDYALPGSAAVNLSVGRSVAPNASGELALNSSLSAGYTRDWTTSSTYGVSVSYVEQEPLRGGMVESLLSLSPVYTRQLTPEAELEASYSFQRNEDGDTSHGVNLTVTRAFDFPLR